MKETQKVTAAQEWRSRMARAKASLPEVVGQQMVVDWIAENYPALNQLTNVTRWRNAWAVKVADVDFTVAVEAAAKHFNEEYKPAESRVRRQNLHRPE